eukprot:gene7090-7303_t
MQQLLRSNWELLQSCPAEVQQVMTELLPKIVKQCAPAVQLAVKAAGKAAASGRQPLDKVECNLQLSLAVLLYNAIQLVPSHSTSWALEWIRAFEAVEAAVLLQFPEQCCLLLDMAMRWDVRMNTTCYEETISCFVALYAHAASTNIHKLVGLQPAEGMGKGNSKAAAGRS